jgi:predicted nucleic acid-binding protein
MTEYVFLDTAALVALMNKKDQYHVQAVNKLDAHLKGSGQLLSTPHVFAETVTRILRRVSHAKAVEAGNLIHNESAIEIVTPDKQALDLAWEIFVKYDDQNFSFVDCISFAVMQQMKITHAFSFDNHFTIMGFQLI